MKEPISTLLKYLELNGIVIFFFKYEMLSALWYSGIQFRSWEYLRKKTIKNTDC